MKKTLVLLFGITLVFSSCNKDSEELSIVLLDIQASQNNSIDGNKYVWITDRAGNILGYSNANEDVQILRPEGFSENKFDVHIVDYYSENSYQLVTLRDVSPGKWIRERYPIPETVTFEELGSATLTFVDIPDHDRFAIGYGRANVGGGSKLPSSRSLKLYKFGNEFPDAYVYLELEGEALGYMLINDLMPGTVNEISLSNLNTDMKMKSFSTNDNNLILSDFSVRGHEDLARDFSPLRQLYSFNYNYEPVTSIEYYLPMNNEWFNDYSSVAFAITSDDKRYSDHNYGSIADNFGKINADFTIIKRDIEDTQLEVTGKFDWQTVDFWTNNTENFESQGWTNIGPKNDLIKFPEVPSEILEIYPWLIPETFTSGTPPLTYSGFGVKLSDYSYIDSYKHYINRFFGRAKSNSVPTKRRQKTVSQSFDNYSRARIDTNSGEREEKEKRTY